MSFTSLQGGEMGNEEKTYTPCLLVMHAEKFSPHTTHKPIPVRRHGMVFLLKLE